MRKNEAVREYLFSDATLIQKCDDVLNSVYRDDSEFNMRGYTSNKREAFRLLRETFNNLPADSSLEGIKISATHDRDNIGNEIQIKLRMIHTIFENKWGKKDGRYKELGATHISRLRDEQLYRTGRGVRNTAEKYIAELKDDGLSHALISELENLLQLYDNAIDIQKEAIKLRDINTEERVISGNLLYKELYKICNLGKDIWYTVNEAKYNDYVIYNTVSGKKEDGSTPVPPTP